MGTLEEVPNIQNMISLIEVEFSGINENKAIVDFDVNLIVPKEEIFNSTFIFILPFDAEINNLENLEIESKLYAKVVYYPVTIDNQTSIGYCSIRAFLPTFSKSIGFGKFAFDVDCRAFHFLFDNDGESFYPLPVGSSENPNWLRMKTWINIEDGKYSITDFHPGTNEHFENSVTWLNYERIFSTHVAGEYLNFETRFSFESFKVVLIFVLGSFSSLLLKKIFE